MDPLIIVATPNTCWLKPEVKFPTTPDDIAREAVLCRERGASVLHTHAEGQWIEVIRAVRGATDIIVQSGMSSLEIDERMDVFREKSDEISIILNHHDEAFARLDCLKLHSKQELEQYAALCAQYGVAPEFEVWHAGSIWNLNYLIDKGLVRPPYITTLFFGWPGGTWSPPTVEEYLYRKRLLPPGSAVTVSIMHEDQMKILAAASWRATTCASAPRIIPIRGRAALPRRTSWWKRSRRSPARSAGPSRRSPRRATSLDWRGAEP